LRKSFIVTVDRVDTYTEDITVLAKTKEEATRTVQRMLDKHGWSGAFGDSDGDLVDCESTIANTKED